MPLVGKVAPVPCCSPASTRQNLQLQAVLKKSNSSKRSERQKLSVQAEKQHLSVCLNKTCKKQGSPQIAKFVEDLGLPNLTVERTGCLGKCGAGPNIILSPLNVQLGHVQTVNKMTEILKEVGGFEIPNDLLKATTLRLQGNSHARDGEFREAIEAYDQALDLHVPNGRHLILSNRAGVLMALGKYQEALNDAEEAVSLSPPDFHNARFRQVEACLALGRQKEAHRHLELALQVAPDLDSDDQFRQLKSQAR